MNKPKRKSPIIQVGLDPDDIKKLKRIAVAADHTVSSYVRRLVRQHLRGKP